MGRILRTVLVLSRSRSPIQNSATGMHESWVLTKRGGCDRRFRQPIPSS
ncbi:MAG: hypothetical protein ACFCBU_10105 [Cyanophyceae cyanobacterium]